MSVLNKTNIANVVAGIAVLASIAKGFVNGETTEIELAILFTSLGYLFGAVATRSKNVTTST